MDLGKSEFETNFRDTYSESTTKDLLCDLEGLDDIEPAEKTPTFVPEKSQLSELLDFSDISDKDNIASRERSVDEAVTKPVGDGLSIDETAGERRGPDRESDVAPSVLSNVSYDSYYKSDFEVPPTVVKAPEKEKSPVLRPEKQEKSTPSPSEVAATSDHVNTQAAMESAASGGESPNKTKDCCPFSPGVWFNPEKLHPVVADYIYWRDPKKTGVLFGSSLLLLLSLKFFSLISVLAYAVLAVLSVTVSFRIYKNVLQSVKKSNEGQPFKEYLDMEVNLSGEKLGDNSEVLMHHLNAVIINLRSLILVEDLFDTIKLMVFAWALTYVGAWFDGMTAVILGFVSAFTLPKLYESNQAQIDAYAETIHVKGKELMETINSKIPLGKKKKNE